MPKQKKYSRKKAFKIRSGSFATSAPSLRVSAAVALIAVIAFFAYFPSISGEFILDDNLLLTENTLIMSPDGLCRFWCSTEATDYWPVTNSSLWIEWRLWEMHSTGYHVTNLVLHVIESFMVWLILRKLSVPGAFLAAVIFAVHPVNVESAAWIAQRKNMLAMLFFLMSILWYLKRHMPTTSVGMAAGYVKRDMPTVRLGRMCMAPGTGGSRWYWLGLLAFVLAMLSKGSVAVLPALLLGIDWWHGPVTRRDLVRIAPFFVVALFFTGVNVWLQMRNTVTVIRTAGFAERLLGAGGVVWFYLYKAFMPVDLAFVYPQWRIQPGNPLWWLPLLAALIVTVVLWRYGASWSRPFLFAWGFFCVALVPVLGFIDVGFMQYSLVADHYQHISLIGVIALAAAGWGTWRRRTWGRARWTATATAVAAVACLVFLTWQQNTIYRKKITLYQATLEKNPNCWMAHYGLGLSLFKTGRMQDAIEQFRQAIALKQDYFEAHNNLGVTLVQLGRPKEAIEEYGQALVVKPDYIEARNNLGVALVQTSQPQEAIEHYREALRQKPDYVEALSNLGSAYKALGQYQKAIEQYEKALKLRPDYVDALNNLGNAFSALGQYPEAIEYYDKALKVNPDLLEAHINLGLALVQTGGPQEAIEHYRYVLRLKSNYIEAHYNLGNALLQTGQAAEAIEHYRQALGLKPDLAAVNYNLALAYAKMNQSAQAMAAAQKALELAESQGQTLLARHIEDWINSYRAGQSNLPSAPRPAKSDRPPP